ncbi:hypothetical protein SRHO_G00243100 [Serrasalmus rhombeus]
MFLGERKKDRESEDCEREEHIQVAETEEEEHIGEGDREFSGEAEQEQAAASASVSTETALDLGDRNTGPKQVKLAQYPQSVFGTQKRAFQFNWFQSFNWLEYSCKRDAAFCYACRVFGRNLKQDVFVSGGVKNWRKALSFYHKHESSQSHKDSVIRWQSYKASLLKGSVVQQIESATSTEVQERREYLKRIVAVTSLLGKQGIPFRGHDESCESHDKGMFAECFKLVQKFDPFLKSYTPPLNTTYLSSCSQNEMVQCCAEEVTATIVKEMREAQMFAIMADEARDGKREQLSLCVRYVTGRMIKERFLALTELMGFDAESIANTIEQQLALNGIGDLKCVAQTYDGAAVMSGAVGGVQAHFRKKHPEAVYVHCYAHELNLVLCHTCRAISEAREFFEILESVYSFFSSSLVNHHKFVETQTRLGLQQTELVQLSSTRWACQLRSVNCVLDNFPAIIECLLGINTPLAVGLRVKLCKFSSVYLLVMFHTLLSLCAGLHLYLQKENIDLARAMEYKNAVTDSLKEKRSDSTAGELHARALAICDANKLVVSDESSKQRRKTKRMVDYVVESNCGAGAGSEATSSSNADDLKQRLLFPCLDRMLAELEKRFSDVSEELLCGIQACSPKSEQFLSVPLLSALALHYNIDLKPAEVMVASNFFKRKNETGGDVEDMLAVYKQLDADMFPTLKATVQAALTIPVSSCSCERSFSALRRLHTWLRRTMGQNRLHHLAVMSIEKELLDSISPEIVIDRFANLKVRRHRLVLPK